MRRRGTGRRHNRGNRQHRQGRDRRRMTNQRTNNRQQKKKTYRFIIKQGFRGVKRRLIVEIGMDKQKNLLVTIWDSRNNRPSIRLYEHEMNGLVKLYQNLITKVKEEMLPDYDFDEYKQQVSEEQFDADLLNVSDDSEMNQAVNQAEQQEEITDSDIQNSQQNDLAEEAVEESKEGTETQEEKFE